MEKETKHSPEHFKVIKSVDGYCLGYVDDGSMEHFVAERIYNKAYADLFASAPTLKAENTRLKSELLHRDVTVLPQKDFEFEEMKASLQSEIEKFRDEFKCPQCMGHGWFQSNNGNQPTQDQCHVCYGTGTLGRGYFQLEIDRLQTELSEIKKEVERLKEKAQFNENEFFRVRDLNFEMKKRAGGIETGERSSNFHVP